MTADGVAFDAILFAVGQINPYAFFDWNRYTRKMPMPAFPTAAQAEELALLKLPFFYMAFSRAEKNR
jgi:hypothetical protein